MGLLFDGVVKAAEALNVSIDYLAGLTDRPVPAAELIHPDEAAAELCALPHRSVAGAAGGGTFVDSEDVVKLIGFRRDWLRKLGLNPEKCSVIDVVGNSMEPTLHERAMILIDQQRTRRQANRIFAVRSDDGLLIKRLAKADGSWLLVSDNEAYPTVPWPREAEVVGQVMWTGRTL